MITCIIDNVLSIKKTKENRFNSSSYRYNNFFDKNWYSVSPLHMQCKSHKGESHPFSMDELGRKVQDGSLGCSQTCDPLVWLLNSTLGWACHTHYSIHMDGC